MDRNRVRSVVAARLLGVLQTSENDQAVVAAGRTLLEIMGNLGAGSKRLTDEEEASASAMTPEAMRKELEALRSRGDRKQ
jgi:hypothetical protein